MSAIPSGGPSTINGVLYQMLWALARVGFLSAQKPIIDSSSGELLEVTLTLEPIDGGDQQGESGGRRVVEQLKSRSGNRTWSLQELVTEVLPDLYRAVDPKRSDTAYRFVTEGRMGGWRAAYDFFRSLKDRTPTEDMIASLDNSREVRFRRAARQKGHTTEDFWGTRKYTERRLFERIVERLRSFQKDGAKPIEPIELSHEKVWCLLANLEFDDGRTVESLQRSIDAWLARIVPAIEGLATKRDALLLDLARRATVGAARIAISEFLNDHGLNATDLSKWIKLTHKAADHLRRTIRLRKMNLDEEARPGLTEIAFSKWSAGGPILLLSGDSGQGKSWLGYSLLLEASRRQEAAIAVDARSDADKDQEIAAQIFWQGVVGHDNAPPFERICERLCKAHPEQQMRRVSLLVDGVNDCREASRLACLPWEDWGVRVVMTCLPHVAKTICEATQEDRISVVPVPDFTVVELQEYLSSTIGDHWVDVPQDVRSTLCRPLLARLYREISVGGRWHPTKEYELYEKYWYRILRSEHGQFPLDAVALGRAAQSLLSGEPYPWSTGQLEQAGMDNDAIARLLRLGWLVSPRSGQFKVWHDRLLNWATAEGIVADVQTGRLAQEEACKSIQDIHSSVPGTPRLFLGYVPMDVMWIACGSENCMHQFAARILSALESR
jgi:hypothetical protein